MIAPRKNIPSASGAEVTETRAALQQLTAPVAQTYGSWRSFETADAAVRAVIAEIGEVVLARTIEITAQNSECKITLTVSNRHLVALGGVSLHASTEEASQVVQAIQQALAGARHLRFDIAAKSPAMPNSTRSWSIQALRDAMESQKALSDTRPVFERLKALSVAWLDVATSANDGPDAALCALRHMARTHNDLAPGQDQFCRERAKMVLYSMTPQLFAVEVVWQGAVLMALCEAQKRTDLLDVWRQLVAEEQPSHPL